MTFVKATAATFISGPCQLRAMSAPGHDRNTVLGRYTKDAGPQRPFGPEFQVDKRFSAGSKPRAARWPRLRLDRYAGHNDELVMRIRHIVTPAAEVFAIGAAQSHFVSVAHADGSVSIEPRAQSNGAAGRRRGYQNGRG